MVNNLETLEGGKTSMPKIVVPPTPVSKTGVRKSPKRTVAVNRTYDWEAIRNMYVEGLELDDGTTDRQWLTLKEIAERFDRPVQRIYEKSAEQRWPDMRLRYQDAINQQRQKERASLIAKEGLDLDSRALSSAKLAINLVIQRLADISKDASYHQTVRKELEQMRAAGLPIKKEDLYGPVYHVEMMNLARAVESWQNIGKRALGDERVQRVEVSGPGGSAIDVNGHLDVRQELQRDDPERLNKFFEAAQSAGLLAELMSGIQKQAVLGSENDIQDAEVIVAADGSYDSENNDDVGYGPTVTDETDDGDE